MEKAQKSLKQLSKILFLAHFEVWAGAPEWSFTFPVDISVYVSKCSEHTVM